MAYKVIIISLCLLSFFSQSESGCTDVPVATKDLDLVSFMGTWYEYKTYLRVYEPNGECASVEFTLNAGTGAVHMKTMERVLGTEILDIAKLDKWDPSDKSGNFNITYFFKSWTSVYHKIKITNEKHVYRVLGTDYKCWAVTYTCDESNLGTFGRTYVFVRRRDAACLRDDKRKKIEEILNTINTYGFGALSLEKSLPLTPNHQANCWKK